MSLMRMDEGLDTGPLVASRADRPRRHRDRARARRTASPRSAPRCSSARSSPGWPGELEPSPAGRGGRDADTAAPARGRTARSRRSAADLERQVRAYQPWPGSFVDTPFGRLVVWRSIAGGRRGRHAARRRSMPSVCDQATATGSARRGPAGRRQADVLGGLRPRPARRSSAAPSSRPSERAALASTA